MKRLRLLTLYSILAATFIFFFKKRVPTTIAAGEGLVIKKEWLIQNNNPVTSAKDCRPADQTFLTFPEWYLVFSPEEQANYFKHHTSTTFPFMTHTKQIWQSYKIVNDQIKDNFPVNKGYHFMIWVIGSSASVEYSIKAWYETVIGRVTDTYESTTDEDKFNAVFTQDYVDFIKDRPWYEFDFKSRLKNLWMATPIFGSDNFRKLDRRYILTSELAVKYVYGKLIGLGTKSVYDEALPSTYVLTDNKNLLNLPRYDKFNQAITELAKKGDHFKEIAGNNSAILLTVLVPANSVEHFGMAQTVFIQPISSDMTMKRVALAVPVPKLAELLVMLDKDKVRVEHIFDY